MGKQGLGEFELLVLLAALRLGGDGAHAVSIVDEINARTGRDVRRSAVYVTLQRLEKKGMVSTRMGDPLPERGGKGRRLVRVEPVGQEAVREMQQALTSMWGGLDPAPEQGR
jgi:PadR family transcriptional regulator PadR